MAYDEELAGRARAALRSRRGVTEKKMFGGLAYLLGGRMFCGIVKDDLMVRVGPDRHAEALRRPHVRPMDFTGRPMKGYVFVGPAGLRTERALSAWLARGADFVATLDGPARRRLVAGPARGKKPDSRVLSRSGPRRGP